MEAASIPWRPLGELLVEHGLLSHLQLETALAEQDQSGRRLGEVLVERGYVTAQSLRAALAEQLGVDLGQPPAVEPAKRPVLRIVRLDEEPEILDAPPALDHHRARLAEAQLALAQRDLRIAELENRLARFDSPEP